MTREQVTERWKVRAPEREALLEMARHQRASFSIAKRYAAELGLFLAYAEIDEERPTRLRVITPADVLRRALHHACRAVSDHTPARSAPARLEYRRLRRPDEEAAAPAVSEATRQRVEALRALDLSPAQAAMVQAILDEQCTTLADVDRLMGWSDGAAAVQASRIRRKIRRG